MTNDLELGSLFDGSGGFPLAGSLCGITPVWASEVEPYPIAVTRSRFPGMKHLGDISKINGAEIEPVDVITFGSPCQDLSVAGKRAGIKHEAAGDEETTRSGLFMEAVRIIKEMRDATNGVYQNVVLWENVPGAFSSNRGEDFRTVLVELIKIVEPDAVMPPVPKAGWAYADSYTGDGWSLAYRVFDAQYWGVPQRRRRIHLVLDLGGQRAKEILFEREGLRGYFEASSSSWKGTKTDLKNGIRAAEPAGDRHAVAFQTYQKVSGPLMANSHPGSYTGQDAFSDMLVAGADCLNMMEYPELHPTLHAKPNGGQSLNFTGAVRVRYLVRMLTPTEWGRLQGFADMWAIPDHKDAFTYEEYRFWLDVRNTHAAIIGKTVKEYTKEQMLNWYSKLHTDSAEYKMWGNGIALPPALYCIQGIVDALEKKGNANG